MRELDLKDIDLNLLVVLDVLLEEASVTKAAARLGVAQPTLSHSLRRLRELLGDELLVRGKTGMVLTPRGQELALPVRRAMMDLRRALGGTPAFEPRTAVRTFTVSTTDFEGAVLMPALLELLGQQAPGIELVVRPIEPRHYAEQLETGAVDLLVGFPLPSAPGMVQRLLLKDEFVCVVRQGHPRVRGKLDLDLYCELHHALVSPRNEPGSMVDTVLAGLGRSRKIAFRVPSFLAAPVVVSRSELVLTVPRLLAQVFANPLALQLLAPPIELPPIPLFLYWHERYDADPANRWLRQTLLHVAQR